MTPRQRLLSGSTWAFGGRLALAFTGLVNNALLARLLSPQDMGAYFLAYSLVWVGATVGTLGLNQAIVRFVAESVAIEQFSTVRKTVGAVTMLGLIGAFSVGAAYLLFGPIISADLFDSPALLSITGLVAGWMVMTSLQNLFAGTFRGFHDIRLAAIFSGPLTGVLLLVALSVLLWSSGSATLTTVVLLAASSGFVSALLASWLLKRKIVSIPSEGEGDSRRLSEVFNVAWPLLVSSVTVFVLTQADIWILGAFKSQEEVAVYGAAARLVNLVAMPLLVVNAVVPPLIAEMHVQGRKRELESVLRAASTLAGIPAFLVLLAFAALSGPILNLVYGDFYRTGYLVLILLSVGRMVSAWAGSCGITLMMTGYQKTAMSITVLTGLLTVLGAIWSVQEYGAEGVAVVTSIMLILQNLLMILFAKIRVGIWTHASLSIKSAKSLLFGSSRQ